MAKKLRQAPITANEILGFVDTQADFAFEMKVQARLLELGFGVEHGGTYVDPATGIPRQYDIRASRDYVPDGEALPFVFRMAVECKTIAEWFPLVVFTVPRTNIESAYDLLVSGERERQQEGHLQMPSFSPDAWTVTMTGLNSLYPANEAVGKSCTQVGLAASDESEYVSGDAGVYGKWSQAISSSHELVARSHEDFERLEATYAVAMTLPVLVVPDGRLWTVKYDEAGVRISSPETAHRIPYLINKKVIAQHHMSEVDYNLSHLEIVTFSGLDDLVNKFDESNRSQIVDLGQVSSQVVH